MQDNGHEKAYNYMMETVEDALKQCEWVLKEFKAQLDEPLPSSVHLANQQKEFTSKTTQLHNQCYLLEWQKAFGEYSWLPCSNTFKSGVMRSRMSLISWLPWRRNVQMRLKSHETSSVRGYIIFTSGLGYLVLSCLASKLYIMLLSWSTSRIIVLDPPRDTSLILGLVHATDEKLPASFSSWLFCWFWS